MKRKPLRSFFSVCLLLIAIVSPAAAAPVHLSAAASMSDALKEMIALFQQQHPDIHIILNLGSSGAMAKQIDQGAPADLYISANPKWMDFLVEQKKIVPATRRTFATNRLVFIGKKESMVSSLTDLTRLTRIGIGTPASVPAGQYARQALTSAKLYEQLLSAGKLVMAKDVRQALIYADRGETDGSFVYKTDALLARNTVILFEVPSDRYDEITYPIALTVSGAARSDTRVFFDFITSDVAAKILISQGFNLDN